MATEFFECGVWISALLYEAHVEKRCYQPVFYELYDGNHQQWHIIPLLIHIVEPNIIHGTPGLWKIVIMSYKQLADPTNLSNHDYIHFFYCNRVEWIEYLMQRPVFRVHIL
jgi:hypothetical protein